MTTQETSERYQIPMDVLRAYERWNLCGLEEKVKGQWRYDDIDLERLGTIMTLLDVGFTIQEAEAYMRLQLDQNHTESQRLRMLEEKRGAALNQIHTMERQIQRLDDLRHEIRKHKDKQEG